MPPLIPVQEALNRLLNAFHPLEKSAVPLEEAIGRVLAEEIRAQTDYPLFDNSSMDGFALLASDLTRACAKNPVSLEVVDDIPAGKTPKRKITRGKAARIMTGAPLPVGADTVVPVEDTDFNNRAPGAPPPQRVQIFRAAKKGENIRKRGEDIRADASILQRGQWLRAQDLGILAMLGYTQVCVTRKPRVALLSSGDELTPPGEKLQEAKIYDINSYTLRALLKRAGCEVISLGVAADTPRSVLQALDNAQNADLILSSAGVSMGSFDFIKSVIEKNGHLDFWRINMRPGKPLTFGSYRHTPFLGLAGNPVSAFVGFLVFVQPIIEKMLGSPHQAQNRVRVRLAEPIQSDGRESYLRAIIRNEKGQFLARLTGHQGAGNIFSMVRANALLIVPAGIKSLPKGAEVNAWLLK